MTIGERLRKLRLQHGLRLHHLQARCGYSLGHLNALEHGQSQPSVESLCGLASAYGMTVQALLAPLWPPAADPLARYPLALQELARDPVLGGQVTPEELDALARIEHRGRRPQTAVQYLALLMVLRRVIV